MRNIWLPLLSAIGLFAQDKPAADLRTEKTQTIEFVSGGLLRMKNSTGMLTIEAWDKPAVELTTIKSARTMLPAKERAKATAQLDQTAFTTERHGNELDIATAVPKHARDIEISYHLWVPRDTRLAIDHASGEVNIEGVAADIEATLSRGEIFLYLPDDAAYSAKAKSGIGGINLPGDPELRPLHLHLGHSIAQEGGGKTHILDLKVGYGDIYVMRQTGMPKRVTE